MTLQQAKNELIVSYEKKFGELPDLMTRILIDVSAPRLMAGEKLSWKEDDKGNWRTLYYETQSIA